MTNLGKIVIFIFFIPTVIFAGVRGGVDLQNPTKGETVTFKLHISGENIKRPNLFTLCGENIVSSSSQTSIQMINGDYQKTYTLSYQFVPQESCQINPVEVEIDGKVEKTKLIKIDVRPMSVAKDSAFVLELKSTKKDVYIGEEFEVTLVFKQRRDAEAVDSKFVAPELKGFWLKNEDLPKQFQEGNYAVREIKYRLSAQRAGELKITPAQIKIASRDNTIDSWGAWIPQLKWRTYFSNELNINVKKPPQGVDLVGDFNIEATADKTEINAGEAVNVKIKVQGNGNLEDIASFKPYINGVSVFDEKISVKKDKLSQKMAFIADQDFVIPPFTLKYFNPKTKEIKSISTKEIRVKVKGAKAKQELNIKRGEVQAKEAQVITATEISIASMSLLFILGIVFGVILMLLQPWNLLKKDKKTSIKDPKQLLIRLLPYKDDETVKEIVEKLEKSIYSGEKIEIDKKVLKEILKIYDIN